MHADGPNEGGGVIRHRMSEPLDILSRYWGYDSFRPLQAEIIDDVLSGRDTLALMPTGGGKSICFQVPALAREGICIVISPLISLMKDQVFQLQKRGISAEAVYSGMRHADIDRILDNCVLGRVKLLYLSPERLTTDLAKERIKRMKVNLLAVDEAHCISQWGYDFRPAYLNIAELREQLPDTPVLALTATATPEVVTDIQNRLQFAAHHVQSKSFRRSNLSYVVLHEEGKWNKLLDILRKVPGSGVIYVRSRRKSAEIATHLSRLGISADAYHAGLTPEERSEKQDAWIAGKTRIMVATNAFGMGIDKPDVRTVIHTELPDSLEAYFQEAGRAGRDGNRAYAVLLYQPADSERLHRQYEVSHPSLEDVRRVYRALGNYFQLAVGAGKGASFDFELAEFSSAYKLNAVRTWNALRILEQEGWISLTEAVFVPPSLHIIVSKEQLYDYQLRNRQSDTLIKTILRTCQGAFLQPVRFPESQIARFLEVSVTEIDRMLNRMAADGILRYFPRKDRPQLTFLEERVDAAHLTWDNERQTFLQTRHLDRIRKAIDYAERPECRNVQLLRYFGEEGAEPCGLCDVCLGREKKHLSPDEFEHIREELFDQLGTGPSSLDEVMEAFSPKYRKRVLQVLHYLIDEGDILSTGTEIRKNPRR